MEEILDSCLSLADTREHGQFIGLEAGRINTLGAGGHMYNHHDTLATDEVLRARLEQARDNRHAVHLSLMDPAMPQVQPGQLPIVQSASGVCACHCYIREFRDTGELVVTWPDCWQSRSCMTPGRYVYGLIGQDNERMAFTSHVLQVKTKEDRSVAMILAPPIQGRRAQRRRFCRVGVVGSDATYARVWQLRDLHECPACETLAMKRYQTADPRQNTEQCASPRVPARAITPALEGLLFDISAGGVGLRMPGDLLHKLSRESRYWIELKFSSTAGIMPVVARFIHCYSREALAAHVGFEFLFGHHERYRTFFVDEVCRFVAQYQQEQLRRNQGRDRPPCDL